MPTPRKHANPAARQRAYVERRRAARLAELAAKNLPASAPISTMPSLARWRALGDQAQAILQTLLAEMEAYRDERSGSWQESDKGQAFDEVIERVTEALATTADIAL